MDEQLEQVDSFIGRLILSLEKYWDSLVDSLPRIVLALILLILVLFFAAKIKRFLIGRLTNKAHDPLFARFVAQLSKAVIVIVGLLLVLRVLGLTGIATGLLTGAGVSALVFGFAFKDIGENFLAGIILAFNRPFSMHDAVQVEGTLGYVIGLGFRVTHIKTFDEKDVFIPNATLIKETVTNLTRDGLLRMDFTVGIAYEDDIAEATQLIIEVTRETEGVLQTKAPFVVVDELAVSTVNLKVYFWTDTKDYRKGVLVTKGEVMRKVKETLSGNGIAMPANIQELKLYEKAEALPITLQNGGK